MVVFVCIFLGLNLGAWPAQTKGRPLKARNAPVSETWGDMVKREAAANEKLQADIRAGRRPAHPIPHVSPDEDFDEEEEHHPLKPGRDSGPSTPPLERRMSIRGAAPLAPQSISTSFKGDDLQDAGTLTGFYFIPPDTQGAVGPSHFMEMTNGTATIFDKSGTKLSSVSLDSFFSQTISGTTYPRNGSTDPRIIYDRRSSRWYACIIEIGGSSSGSQNNILFAVCRTSNPLTGTWDKYLVPTAQGPTSGNTLFNDYESLGTDDNGVYFGMRVFAKSGSHARIVCTGKASLTAASPSLGTMYDFDNITDMYSTPQPANNHDAVAASGKAWMVSSNHTVYANMNYRRITWSAGVASIDSASTILTTPAFSAPLNPPSSGATTNADIGDMRMMMAMIRNNSLWCCRHVGVNSSGGSTSADRDACEFIQLNVSGATASVTQTGRIYDTAASTPRYYYYPSLVVSGQGSVVMGMTGSKSTEFMAMYTCGRYASDPTGTMGTPTLVKAGEAKYTVTFSGTRNRWGDYSFTSLDPNDDMSMWTIQEYARTPVGTQDIWGTWISRMLAPAPTLNNPGASGAQGTNGYNLALTGTGFYDPGAGYTNRLSVKLTGGTTNGISNYAVTYNSSTSVNVSFDIAGNATPGTRDIILTNPDGQSATAAAGFTVTSSSPNTTPTVTVPGAQSVNEDTNLTIGGISVSDADVGSGDMQMTLTAPNGTLTLSSTSGLSFTSGANGTASMVFTGTLINVNTALNNLVYRGSSNYNGSDLITITANDQGNSGSGGALSDTKTVAVTINTVNDAPAITVPGAQTVNEDTNLVVAGISASDVDIGTSSAQATLSASNGTITLSSTAGLSFSAGANGTSTMTFTGTLANFNTAVSNLTYRGNSNYNGTDSILISLNDQGGNGSGGALSDNKSISVTVSAVNDAPSLTVPGAQSVNEDTNLVISGISASDVDIGTSPAQVTLSASNGILTLSSTAGLSFTSGASGTSSMVFTGTLTNANTALNNLTYRGNSNFSGTDTVSLTLSDQGGNGSGGAKSDSKTISITVSPVNDAPVITVPGAQSASEDTNLVIAGISVSDVDIGTSPAQATLSASSGILTLSSTTGLSFSSGANGTSSMVFTGTLTNVNTALNNLTYKGNTNFSGSDTISLMVSDQGGNGSGGALSDSKTIAVTVSAVNDAPVVTVPGAQSVNEDTSLTIAGISASDVDIVTSPAQVTLSASNGIVTLSSTSGLSFTSGANGTSTMVFTGTLANANTALNNLAYKGNSNFSGTDTVSLTVSDQGGNGSGGAKSDSKTISVTVLPVNDAPVVTVPGAQSASEDTNLVIAGISFSDVDIGTSPAQVTLSATNGILTLSSTTGLSFTAGANGTSSMVFTGTLTNVNAALNNLTYKGNANLSGSDTISLVVNDQGGNGSGGALSDSKTISVSVSAVNDAPVVIVPGAQSVNEDTNLTIAGISASDVDIGTSPAQVTLSASSGILTLSSTTGLSFTSGANGTSSMSFTGTLANANTALNNLTYRGNLNFNGTDTTSITVSDQGGNGSGGAKSDSKTIAMTVNAVNDAPVLSVPGAQSATEDTNLVIGSISFSDVDIGTSPAQVTLSASNGILTLSSTTGLSFTSGANGTSSMMFTGTLTNINTALNNLTYKGNTNFNGSDTISLTASDQGGNGSGGALSDSKSISVTVSAVNDAPVATVPGSQSVNEDTTLTVSGISASDVDIGTSPAQVTLSASNGVVALSSTTGLSFTSGANATSNMVFTGTLTNVNTALTNLSYRGNTNFNGADTISLTINDQGGNGSGGVKSDTKTIGVTVNAVNDAPVITVPGSQVINEDTTLTVSGMSIADVDAGSGQLSVTLAATTGTVTLSTTTGLSFSSGANGTSTMTFAGTLTNLNSALSAVAYRAPLDYNGADVVGISVNDQGNTGGGAQTDSRTINVTVSAVNDAPAMTVPGSQSVLHDTDLTLPAITILDVDAGTGLVQFKATVSHGTVRLVSTAGLSSVTGNNSAALTTTGTLAAINSALNNNLVYRGGSSYNGSDTINCTFSDQGNTGSGGSQSDVKNIPITVALPVSITGFSLE